MQKPSIYKDILAHTLQSWRGFGSSVAKNDTYQEKAITHKLWQHSKSSKGVRLDGLDMASEFADHFLAGFDTPSSSLMFALWALSRSEGRN